MCPRRSPARARGFSLLEAVVALAVLAAAGLAYFTLIVESQRSLQRSAEAIERLGAERSVEEWLRGLNPAEQLTGSVLLGGLAVDWRAEPLAAFADVLQRAGVGLYRVAAFRVAAKVRRIGRDEFDVVVIVPGWQQVRKPGSLLSEPVAEPNPAQPR